MQGMTYALYPGCKIEKDPQAVSQQQARYPSPKVETLDEDGQMTLLSTAHCLFLIHLLERDSELETLHETEMFY